MNDSYYFPSPSKPPNLTLTSSEFYLPPTTKPFRTEFYWNIESSPILTKQHLLSQILPVYLESLSLDMVRDFMEYYIYGNIQMPKHLIIVKDKSSNQVEGFTSVLELNNYYLLPNNFTKENSYVVYTGMSAVKTGNRNKGIYKEMLTVYSHSLCQRSLGKNVLFFDTTINPIVYMHICRFYPIYPSYKNFCTLGMKDFIFDMAKIFQEEIVDQDSPFCVYDGTLINGVDKEYWNKNYKNLPKDMQFYIDQTKLRDGYGIMYVAVGNLLPGNTLGLPSSIYTQRLLPDFEVSECIFGEPKI